MCKGLRLYIVLDPTLYSCPSLVTVVRDVVEETIRMTRIFIDPQFLRCEALFDGLNMLEQCFSTTGLRYTGPGQGLLEFVILVF